MRNAKLHAKTVPIDYTLSSRSITRLLVVTGRLELIANSIMASSSENIIPCGSKQNQDFLSTLNDLQNIIQKNSEKYATVLK